MPSRSRLDPRRLAWAGIVVALLLAIGWLAVRATVVRTLAAGSAPVLAIAPHDGRMVLDRTTELVTSAKAPPPAAVYAPLAAAAAAEPLDDRPFLLFAIRALAEGRDAHALQLLEEGRRRNPRQRFTRLLLLDRYLRANRVADAVVEMTVLNRLLPAARGVLGPALAKFAVNPATSRQARQALDDDPELLNQVLVAMTAAKADAGVVQRFAGAHAPVGLQTDGWRTLLIQGMIERGDFVGARQVWARAYRVDVARAAAPVYDLELRGAPGGAPFNWTLSANEVGAVEVGGGAMAVEYYGRRGGPLATQLVALKPGRYRLGYAVSGSGGDSNGGLAWTLTCRADPATVLVTSQATPLRPAARLVAADFAVPATGCPAQLLSLDGLSGGFAGSTSARFTRLALETLP